MADNRKILRKIRGAKGKSFELGSEDALAAECSQERLDQLKRNGVIEGDWKSTITADENVQENENKKSSEDEDFQPLSIEETMAAMKKLDFSDRVTRSMTFHGEDLKKAMQASSKSKEGAEKSKEEPKEKENPKQETKTSKETK